MRQTLSAKPNARPFQSYFKTRRSIEQKLDKKASLKPLEMQKEVYLSGSDCGEGLPYVEVHLELEDAFLRSTIQSPSILAHGQSRRPHAQSCIMRRAT
jgi:hypothetical protein